MSQIEMVRNELLDPYKIPSPSRLKSSATFFCEFIWLDSITDSMDTNLSKLRETVQDRGA